MDEMAKRRMAEILMSDPQWSRVQQMRERQNFADQGAPGYAGLPGAQGGSSSPWAEVAGGGSTANALPPANPMVDDRRYYGDMADNGFASSMLGYGTALGTLAFAPPNPFTLALGLGGIGLGTLGSAMKTRGETEARRLGYQGN